MCSVPVRLTLAGLAVDDVVRVALDRAPVEVGADVLARVETARTVVERLLAGDQLVYGLNTGLGHLRDAPVTRDQLTAYQERIVAVHAGGVGPALPDQDVRALMLARIAGIARGGSGAHPDALRSLVALLNAGVHPVVPEVGSVGASDLMHMAAIAAVVSGSGQARYRGETLPGSVALQRAGLTPHRLQPKDALALISGNAASIGLGALVVHEVERVAALADQAGALTLEAIRGNVSPFDAEVAAAKPIPGQMAAAAHVRDMLAGSYLHQAGAARSVQDPLSFRVMPQVHGALREQIDAARRSVAVELNAIDDNPLVSIERGTMLSNGNFHPMVLALAFDALRVGIAHTGMISERRMNKIGGLKYGSTTWFIGGHDNRDGGPSIAGFLAYAAAATVAALKHQAAPATLHAPPLDLDIEDHATLAPSTVMLTRHAVEQLETVLLIEALLATDVLDNMWDAFPQLGAGTRRLYDLAHITVVENGRGRSAAEVVEILRGRVRASADAGRSYLTAT